MTVFIKIMAFFTALLQMLCLTFGIKKVQTVQMDKEGENLTVTLSDDSMYNDTILYAYNLKNAVQCVYTDPERSAYRMTNGKVRLTHTLTGRNKSATLTDKDGKTYIGDSFTSFYVDEWGVKHTFEKTDDTARVNTIRLGLYYYECHIRDMQKDNYYLDKTCHIYGDKLYMQYGLLCNEATESLGGFGSEIKIEACRVKSVQIKDKNGIHDNVKKLDANTVEYVAFDIENVGVVGLIVPNDGSVGKTVVERGLAYYTVTQYAAYQKGTGINDYTEEGGYDLNRVTFGCRIYTDDTHSFDGVQSAAYEERHPLEGITVDAGNCHAAYLGYEALRGTYTLTLDGTDFQTAYDDPDHQFESGIHIACDDKDRNIIVRANGKIGCLEAAALLDENQTLLPIDVEVCKNFQGDGGEDIYSNSDYQYGDAFFPLALKAGKTYDFTLLHLYQNWGKSPLKQLSSIEFHTSYYHLSTGTTESNCIAPYFVYEKDGWTLPDFRTRSGRMWYSQPQFNSVGVLKFVTHTSDYFNQDYLSEYSGGIIHSTGLSYADITNYYTDDEGRFTYSVRHTEMPQTDENRTYYTLKIDFTDEVTYLNFKENFNLFYFDSRYVAFDKADYLNENNEPVSVDVNTGENTVYYPLGKEAPFMGFYQITEEKEALIDKCFGCNFALLIRDSEVTVNGKQADFGFVFKDTSVEGRTSGALTLNTETVSFKKGDSITVDMILLPWGVGRETTDDNVLYVREDSVLNPAKLTAAVGRVENDATVPTVTAENQVAEFTLSGGRNHIAVAVNGFNSYKAPKVQVKTENGWEDLMLASSNGYDGYSVRLTADGTYTFSFVYDKTDVNIDVSFRVTV